MIPKLKKETVKKPSGTSTNKFKAVEEYGEEKRHSDDDEVDGVVVRRRRLGVNVADTDPGEHDESNLIGDGD